MAGQHRRKPWYRREEYILLLIVVCFPVGLYLMWKYTKWRRDGKMVISGIMVFLFLLVFIVCRCSSSSSSLKSVSIATDGAMELNVGETREITITVKPSKFKTSDLTFNVDDPTLANFTASEDGKAVITALQPGAVIVDVSSGKVKSNSLVFTIDDPDASTQTDTEEAVTESEISADSTESAEVPQETATEKVKTTAGVNIRSGPGTSYEIIGSADEGKEFTRKEALDSGWSIIDFNGQDAYVSSNYLVSAGE